MTERVVNQIDQAVAANAEALVLFPHSWLPGYWDTYNVEADVAAAVKAMVDEIQRMVPVLLGGERLKVTLADGSPVVAGAWKYQEKVYVKAVNTLKHPVSTGFAVEGIGSSLLRPLREGDGASLQAHDNEVGLTLNSLESAWYTAPVAPPPRRTSRKVLFPEG